jgi:hypothetical protein
MRSGGLVRGRLVIDGRGLGLGTIKHIGLVKSITSLAKAYFPETTASATIIRAPFVFAQIFRLVKPLLTPQQQRKVAIFGEDFESGLKVRVQSMMHEIIRDDMAQINHPTM